MNATSAQAAHACQEWHPARIGDSDGCCRECRYAELPARNG